MIDLERQIRDYYESIRIPVSVDEATGEDAGVRPVGKAGPSRRDPRPGAGWRRPLVVAAASAAGVLALGAVLLLVPLGGAEPGPEPPVTSPQTAADALVDDLSVGWTRLDRADASLGAYHVMVDVATGEGILVSIGMGSDDWSDDWVWTSEDGQAWTLVPHDADWADQEAGFEAVAASDTGFVVVGTQYDCAAAVTAGADLVPAVWTSPDGFTWSPIPCEQLIPDAGWNGLMWDVTAGGPGLVAAGFENADESDDVQDIRRGAVWTSPDGASWTRVAPTPDFEGAMIEMVTTTGSGLLVAAGYEGTDPEGRFLGGDTAVWVSPDGFEWTKAPAPPNETPADFVEFGGDIFAVGSGVWRSPDGLTWTQVADLPDCQMASASEFDGVLVAAGHCSTSRASGMTTVPGQESTNTETPYNAAIWVSADGIEWLPVPDDGTFTGIAGLPAPGEGRDYGSTALAVSLTPDGTGLVAVGDAVWMWSSPE